MPPGRCAGEIEIRQKDIDLTRHRPDLFSTCTTPGIVVPYSFQACMDDISCEAGYRQDRQAAFEPLFERLSLARFTHGFSVIT
jgi:hypothetical protein